MAHHTEPPFHPARPTGRLYIRKRVCQIITIIIAVAAAATSNYRRADKFFGHPSTHSVYNFHYVFIPFDNDVATDELLNT